MFDFQYDYKIIVMLGELPMYERVVYKIGQDDLRLLNAAATKLVKDHYQGQVQIFDSFFPLAARYSELCAKYKFPHSLTREFRCKDTMHAGFVVNDHFGQMLMNYLCNP